MTDISERSQEHPVTSKEETHPLTQAWVALNKYVEEYLEDHEIIWEDEQGREGTYHPNEREQWLIDDTVQGLLDDDFITLAAKVYAERQKDRRANGRCRGCGAPNGEHWGKRPECDSPDETSDVPWCCLCNTRHALGVPCPPQKATAFSGTPSSGMGCIVCGRLFFQGQPTCNCNGPQLSQNGEAKL